MTADNDSQADSLSGAQGFIPAGLRVVLACREQATGPLRIHTSAATLCTLAALSLVSRRSTWQPSTCFSADIILDKSPGEMDSKKKRSGYKKKGGAERGRIKKRRALATDGAAKTHTHTQHG